MTGHWLPACLPGLAVTLTYLAALTAAVGLTARRQRHTHRAHRKAAR